MANEPGQFINKEPMAQPNMPTAQANFVPIPKDGLDIAHQYVNGLLRKEREGKDLAGMLALSKYKNDIDLIKSEAASRTGRFKGYNAAGKTVADIEGAANIALKDVYNAYSKNLSPELRVKAESYLGDSYTKLRMQNIERAYSETTKRAEEEMKNRIAITVSDSAMSMAPQEFTQEGGYFDRISEAVTEHDLVTKGAARPEDGTPHAIRKAKDEAVLNAIKAKLSLGNYPLAEAIGTNDEILKHLSEQGRASIADMLRKGKTDDIATRAMQFSRIAADHAKTYGREAGLDTLHTLVGGKNKHPDSDAGKVFSAARANYSIMMESYEKDREKEQKLLAQDVVKEFQQDPSKGVNLAKLAQIDDPKIQDEVMDRVKKHNSDTPFTQLTDEKTFDAMKDRIGSMSYEDLAKAELTPLEKASLSQEDQAWFQERKNSAAKFMNGEISKAQVYNRGQVLSLAERVTERLKDSGLSITGSAKFERNIRTLMDDTLMHLKKNQRDWTETQISEEASRRVYDYFSDPERRPTTFKQDLKDFFRIKTVGPKERRDKISEFPNVDKKFLSNILNRRARINSERAKKGLPPLRQYRDEEIKELYEKFQERQAIKHR